MKPPRVSLEQWLTFKTVVDEGSFAKAAEALSKSQSAVSYAIAQLNDQLPQAALVLRGRRAVLSTAGEVLYRHAERLLELAAETETVAEALASGVEAEVTIAVDSLLDIDVLLCAFEEFSTDYPHTRLRILETTLSGTTEALLEGRADLVVSPTTPIGYSGPMLYQITMLPVAAPTHPLIRGDSVVTELELRRHRQIVLRDTGARREQDSGWLQADKRWTVSHFSSSVKILRSGLGFGFLPRNWIKNELASGDLVPIPLHEDIQRTLPLYLLLANRDTAGPASRRLLQLVRTALLDAAGSPDR